ncbi:MAG: hypothetical protein WBO96_08650, partial [Enterococcus aquimarinus]
TDDALQQLLLQEVFAESQQLLSPLEMKALYQSISLTENAAVKADASLMSAYNRSRRKITNYFSEYL